MPDETWLKLIDNLHEACVAANRTCRPRSGAGGTRRPMAVTQTLQTA